ncbi:MAG: RluA family pseudouridine synthase [Clostridia bacterium]|nr:RluA family pseudouridine synthase [Clostridia bacterium]
MISLTIISDCDGIRLDAFITERTDLSRSLVKNIADSGNVFVNGKVAKCSYKIKSGDIVEFEEPEIRKLDAIPQEMDLDIVYEDEHLIVVNKPQGMVVHPAPGNFEDTLVNGILAHCHGNLSTINSVQRPGIVHRIDKDTSGLLVVAKNDVAHNGLAEQFKVHSINRVYTCIAKGHFKETNGTVDAPIGRHPVDRKKMAVTAKNSKNAVTHFQVVEELNGYTLLKCKLETGRTHQIRVHMAYIGHPLLGDPVYGMKNNLGLNVQMLHAGLLGFIHPVTGEYIEFSSPPPELFNITLEKLR